MKFKFFAFKLSGLILLIFLLQIFIPGFTDFFKLTSDAWLEPWRFISAILLHGGLGHIAYNLFALILFGSILEKLIGGRKFLIIFFTTGILANLFAVNFYNSSLGASGAIFGVIGALIIIRPMLTVWAFSLPMPLFLAGILWATGDIIGAVGFLSGNPLNNTGNLAHLSGMAFGLFFGAIYRNWKTKPKKEKVVIDEESIHTWEKDWMR